MKHLIFHVLKLVGVFRLCRRITRRGLRILCYHGIALDDEHVFQPALFMDAATFRRRLATLKRKRYPVIPLAEAMRGLADGTLPDCATVITIDDGWYGTHRHGTPTLKKFNMPATIYVTSYYVAKELPVFNVLVRYLLWRAGDVEVDLGKAGRGLGGRFALGDPGLREEARRRVVEHGETLGDATARQDLARGLARALGIDMAPIERDRQFALMTEAEIRAARIAGMDIQLHTHRHHTPCEDQAALRREIDDNRAVLAPLVGNGLEHLCYPSGEYNRNIWPWLREAGIVSATTCEPGFNYAATPPLDLRRFLDKPTFSAIEFEAEMCGLIELARRMRARLWPRAAPVAPNPALMPPQPGQPVTEY